MKKRPIQVLTSIESALCSDLRTHSLSPQADKKVNDKKPQKEKYQGNYEQNSNFRMPLSAIDGILLCLNGGDKRSALHILIGRQGIEEVNKTRNVVEVLGGDAKLMVVISDLLLGDDLLQIIRHGPEQLALRGSRSKRESQVGVLTVERPVKNVSVIGSQANELLKLKEKHT